MSIFKQLYKQAKKDPKRIVLPEGDEPRIVKAAASAIKQNIAKIVLLGDKDAILERAKELKVDIAAAEIIDPREEGKLDEYIKFYCELRKPRNVSLEDAHKLFSESTLYYGAVMLRKKRVDGFVAGAQYTTSSVARAVLRCIEIEPNCATTSGSFLVEVSNRKYGEDGLLLFADCAIVPEPSEEQLADIALTSTEIWTKITGYQARVAMLSFSSKGSSSHPLLEKVRRATEMVKQKAPELIIDGELQADSAIEPSVAQRKLGDDSLRGRANVLIFPNLEAGNIAYKLMQRLAGARVVGPILQGMVQPCSDLSRGCELQEIIDAIVVTSVRAQ